jgi:malate/lactate dehydrogenase
MMDWYSGTKPNEWVSMAVPSDGSYGVPEGLIFSFPVVIDSKTRDWTIIKNLEIDEFAKTKIETTLQASLSCFIIKFKHVF